MKQDTGGTAFDMGQLTHVSTAVSTALPKALTGFEPSAVIASLEKKGRRLEILLHVVFGTMLAEFEGPKTKAVPKSDTAIIVHINRSTPLVYESWVRNPVHSELEAYGPAQYDLRTVDQWLHERQETVGDAISGTNLYAHFIKTDTLKTCLGMRDADAIEKLGGKVFHEVFGRGVLTCWKAVVEDKNNGDKHVLCMFENRGKVEKEWRRINNRNWDKFDPAGRLPS